MAMAHHRRSLGTSLSMRVTLTIFLSLSCLCVILSIWRTHSLYLGSGSIGDWGWGMEMEDGDSSLLAAGAWLPQTELTDADNKGLLYKNHQQSSSIRRIRRRERDDEHASGESNGASSSFVVQGENTQQQYQQQQTKNKNRVYCMVPFIWTPPALHAYHAIRSTWGKRCHILNFFIDPIIGDENVGFYNLSDTSDVIAAKHANNFTFPEHNVVILHHMKRPWHTCNSEENKKQNKPVGNCRNIFEKVWRMMVFVADNLEENDDAEWFVKVDSDTWLFPENVDPYVESRKWSSHDPHYFGHVLNHRRRDRGVSIVAGGAVFLSRAALLAATDAFKHMPMDKGHLEEDGTCRDSYTGTEEVVTAVCLKEHSNITAEPALDAEGREQVALYDLSDILGYNRTEQGEWWFWEGKKKVPCHDDGEDCLGHLPLGFHHYKESQYFYDFEKEFYGSVMNGEEDALLIKKNDGRVASRHWGKFDATYGYFEKIRAAMKKADRTVSRVEQTSLSPQSTLNRLYCMVPFIWSSKYIPAYHAIHKTWGKRCDTLKFMIDPIIGDAATGFVDLRDNSSELPNNFKLPEDAIVISDMKRPWNAKKCLGSEDGNCRNIWEKIWRSWKWVYTNGDTELAEWFVKIDADSYLFPENLKHYVKEKGWSHDEHHYFGHILRHREDDAVPIIAGAAVFFSRATLKAIGSIFNKFEDDKIFVDRGGPPKCMDARTDHEEVITSWCLKEHFGVNPYPALDEAGQELVTVGEIEDVLLWNRTEQGEWWYWKNKPNKHPITGKDNMHMCCGDLPIAFHGYKDPRWFFKLENEFYAEVVSDEDGDKWKSYNWRNTANTNKYFDRVRQAMKQVNDTGS